MKLTNENYFSPEAQMAYFGSSQYKSFLSCEEKALAEIRGEYKQKNTTALTVGSYVDAHFSHEMDLFKAKTPYIFKRDGGLKADYISADYMISRIERDRLFSLFMSGSTQVIKTGEIAGVPFKIKIDSLLDADTCKQIVREFPAFQNAMEFCDGAIVDLKCVKDFEDIWDPKQGIKVPWIDFWGYDKQAAIYQEIEGSHIPFFIAAITKQEEPDMRIYKISQDVINERLIEIEEMVPHYAEVKEGKIQPERCEECEWCRFTKELSEPYIYQGVEV